jgi:hypothetical protein
MIGVVSLGAAHYAELIHPDSRHGILGWELSKEKSDHAAKETEAVNLKRFITIILPLGFIGWILEGVITALMARYIYRMRPDLLRLEGGTP